MTEHDDDWAIFRHLKDARKELRAQYGVGCPVCKNRFPKAEPKILLPGQRCKRDGYQDPRPRLSLEERNAIYQKFGIVEQPYRGVKKT